MKPGGPFERIFKEKSFTDHLISTNFDEAHCISTWGEFRLEYKQMGRLRYLLPKGITIVLTSATLPDQVFKDVLKILDIWMEDILVFRCSNDRPNIHLTIQQINNPLASFADLKFLLREWKIGDPPPPKFLVFFDDIQESIKACQYLKSHLPQEYRHKVNWFNSDMSDTYKEDESQRLLEGNSWGMCTTDSFGMVSRDISL
jgi:superfamily II DNA helicase RecQ